MNWDLFISHASEDKDSLVKNLANRLTELGIKVWYDEFTLKPGDSLSKSIDMGLINSNYGLVVISKAFINKGWTDYELRSLISREVGQAKVILPIWHGITKDDMLNFSPFLADKFAIDTSTTSITDVVYKIIEVVNPKMYTDISRIIALEKARSKLPSVQIKTTDINTTNRKVHHKTLPQALINRIKIFKMVTYDVHPSKIDEVLHSFMCEPEPEREIIIWEAIIAVYLEATTNKNFNVQKKKQIYMLLLMCSTKQDVKTQKYKFLTSSEIDKYIKLYMQNAPSFSTQPRAEYKKENNI